MNVKLIVLLVFLCLNYALFSQTEKWETLHIPTIDALHDVEVLNDSLAYVYTYGTGKIFKTANGGQTWNLVAELDSLYFEQIQFVDKDKGWLVGSPNKIYCTLDGGKTWSDKHIKVEESNKLGLVYGMYFSNFNNGFVAIGGRDTSGMKTSIYQTIDGGNNWVLINSIPEIIVNIEKVGNTFYASGKNLIIKNIDKKRCEVAYKDSTGNVGLIRDLDQNKKGEIVAVSDNGFILKLKNKKWEEKKLTLNRIRSLTVLKGNTFIVVGDSNMEAGNFFTSNNGGKTWSNIPNEFPDIHRINISESYIWIVGKDGFVAKQKF